MKETEQVGIGGYAFILEKDASELMRQYISQLEAHYLAQEGGKEIMEGIEERAAELLLEKAKGGVVNRDHVQAVIDILGRPERIEADDPGPSASTADKKQKKLYRDMDNSRLGGVCSGLAAYFNIEVSWLRIGFVALTLICFFGGFRSGVWSLSVPAFYCVLWLAMPAARTAQDRWAMNGEGTTADDIRRNVQAGIHEMGDAAREVAKSDFFQKFGRLFVVIIGFILLITGASGLASLSVVSLKGTDLFGIPYARFLDELSEHAPAFLDLMGTGWVMVLAALAVILPFVGILYGGIQMIFGFKSPSWKPGLVIFVLWLIILVVLGVLGFAGVIATEYPWV
ncbi:MAG: PspC domain-containing protein [Bacteroidales bacterium]|nr:PspC domain-containing protein [Bacteroidales bacterium]